VLIPAIAIESTNFHGEQRQAKNNDIPSAYLLCTAFLLAKPCIFLAVRFRCTNIAALDILLVVHILFVISIASFVVLIGAAAAIVHHIRSNRHDRDLQAPPEPSFSEHLYAASQYGTPRSPRLVPRQSIQSITAKKEPSSPSETHDRTSSDQMRSTTPHRLHIVAGTRMASSKRL